MECTVVSIYPMPIDERKPGQIPGIYQIPACVNKTPQILHVKDGVDQRFVAGPFQTIPYPVPGEEIAASIVGDLVTSILLTSDSAGPGIFWMPGHLTLEEVMKSQELVRAKSRQVQWFLLLVRDGNDIWVKNRQHKFISDLHRVAAKELGSTVEWLTTADEVKDMKCPVCTSVVSSDAIICSVCRAVLNREKYEKFQFAGGALPTIAATPVLPVSAIK